MNEVLSQGSEHLPVFLRAPPIFPIMLLFSEFLKRTARVLALPLVALAVSQPITSEAAPPKAPRNLVVNSTLAVVPPATGTARYYKLSWDDNSLDESGFRIELRLGNSGPFIYWDTAQADSTEYIVDATHYNFTANTLLQFRVVAFKQNGNKTETSVSNLVEMVVTNGTANINAPTNFRVAQVNDGVLRFSWKDRSTAELYYQIYFKKSVEDVSAYAPLGFRYFDNKEDTALSDRTEVLVKHYLVPGESYNFILRATTRVSGTTASAAVSNMDSALVVPEQYPVQGLDFYTVPRLAAPTGLTGEPLNAEQVILRWTDNSFNETGFEISYRAEGTSTWETDHIMTIDNYENLTSYTIGVGPGGNYQWRVRAISTNSDLDVLESDYSNLATVIMPFIKPEGLTAVTSGVSGTVELEWEDTSEGETAYDIYTRKVGEEEWHFAQSMLANTTRASVTNHTIFDNPTDHAYYGDYYDPELLEKDAEHEFFVVARYGLPGTQSNPSNIATAYVRHGFASRPYHPARLGEAFSYTLSVSDNGNRSSWGVSNLPQGLEFNAITGQITGVPEEQGVKVIPMTVTYVNGVSVTLDLTLRILGPETLPEMGAEIPAVTLGAGTQFFLPLADKFVDPEFERAVRLNTTVGNIDLMLYESLAPEAVKNFMGYVESGAYDGVIFHRSVEDFIVQGGGFVPIQAPNYFSTVTKRPSPLNEPGISNLRGTVAHAKVGGNPDSATHDFFFNLEDNSLKEGIELDNQNAGFTAFARVAGNGMEKVDGIAALPTGSYGTSTASEIIIDYARYTTGSALTDVPMNVTGAAPVAMDVNATVQIRSAREIGAFDYALENSDPAIARVALASDGRLRLDGLAPGSTTIKVLAKDLDNNPLEQTFTVTVIKGHKLPVITRQPVSVAVLPGKKATLRVTATGTALQYQWRKAGENISGANANTYVIPSVQEGQVGEYDVLVSNATTVLTSDTVRVDVRTAPTINLTPPLADRVVEAGKPLVLARTATGAPAPVITWLRSGKTVPKQKAQTLDIPAAAITDGGSYVMRAKNVAGTVDSPPVHVIVVDKTAQLRVTLPNKTVVLTAQASGPDLVYQWKKNGTEIEDDGVRISGTTTAKLTIKKFGTVETDPGNYTCVVRNNTADLEAETGAWKVGLAAAAPTLNAFVPDNAYVGIAYNFTIPGGGSSNTTIASFAVTGLPPGLKVIPATGLITGVPRRAGEYTLKVTARNPKGSRSVTNIPMNVLPMPEPVVGAFIGQVGPSSGLNDNRGGRIDLFVSEAGVITGKLTQGKQVLSFKGEMNRVPGSAFTQGEALVKRPGNIAPLRIVFSAYAVANSYYSGDISGTIYDEVDAAQFVAYRQQYNLSKGRVFPFIGRQHLGFSLSGNAVGDAGSPQGHGYAVATLDNNGVARVVGRMADGTTLTSSSFLGMQNQFLIYQSQYKHTGTVVGLTYMYYMGAVANGTKITYRHRSDGQLSWTKLAQTSAKERSYKAGFGPLTMTVLGMTYPNGGTTVAMDLPTNINGNASIHFDEGGLEHSSIDPDVNPVNVGRTPLIPPGSSDEGNLKLTVSPGTGLFSGSFDVESGRRATFNGLIIPRIPEIPAVQYTDGSSSAAVPGVDALGAGHFLLPQEPADGETVKTSAILSGSVELKPTPITITTHPVAQTVDPGANVTFTVVATAPTALSYQWRKNGTNIANATASSYSRTSVTENDQGTYDVVIKTATSTAISNGAFLDVNDPVSNPVITRTPAANPVLIGSEEPVVFTATAKGAAPFTYRWFKGADEIEGETGSTYTIHPVTETSGGSYSVQIYNSANVQPYPKSSANLLEVAAPITFVEAQRTPDNTTINYGATVTFSIANIDSSGPYTYAWYKMEEGQEVQAVNDEGVPATGATHIIPGVAGSDAGIYKVKVSNAATPVPVESNTVELLISSEVANVSLTRTPSTSYVGLGHSVTFSVTNQGEPDFTFEWYKVVGGVDQLIDGESMASFTIPAVNHDDAGDYKVLVRNDASPDGVWSNIRNLEVQAPVTSATITVYENNFQPSLEDTVLLTAEPNEGAIGSFSYQWFHEGAEIFDAINKEYLISPFDSVHYGEYTVQISNSANNDSPVMSAPITLSPPPEEDP